MAKTDVPANSFIFRKKGRFCAQTINAPTGIRRDFVPPAYLRHGRNSAEYVANCVFASLMRGTAQSHHDLYSTKQQINQLAGVPSIAFTKTVTVDFLYPCALESVVMTSDGRRHLIANDKSFLYGDSSRLENE
jgi:hypothetical protein